VIARTSGSSHWTASGSRRPQTADSAGARMASGSGHFLPPSFAAGGDRCSPDRPPWRVTLASASGQNRCRASWPAATGAPGTSTAWRVAAASASGQCHGLNRFASFSLSPTPAQFPIEPTAPPVPTHRDFVPWRFSDAGRLSAWIGAAFRRPKTCTTADTCAAANCICLSRVESVPSLEACGSLRLGADRGCQKTTVVFAHLFGDELV
jgi:hypothetical protein